MKTRWSRDTRSIPAVATLCGLALVATAAQAQTHEPQQCQGYSYAGAVRAALDNAVNKVASFQAGLGNSMWATVVDSRGVVCLVVKSGGGGPGSFESIWLGSQRLQPVRGFARDRNRTLDRQPLLGGPTRWQPVRPAGKQPG